MTGDTPTASTRVSVRKWMGLHPMCDVCATRHDLTKEEFFVDGRTIGGPWALMCPKAWAKIGVGRFGTGWAQKYNGATLEKMEG